ELGRILLKLALQPLKQRKGVGRGSGEATDHVALADRAHLAGVGLDYGGAKAHLAVAGDDDAAPLAHGEDGCAAPDGLGGSYSIHGRLRAQRLASMSASTARKSRVCIMRYKMGSTPLWAMDVGFPS